MINKFHICHIHNHSYDAYYEVPALSAPQELDVLASRSEQAQWGATPSEHHRDQSARSLYS